MLQVIPSPAATIEVLAGAIIKLLKRPKHEIKIIGTRHGEKLYETLLTKEEMLKAIDMGDYYRIPSDNRDLNYGKFFDRGNTVKNIDEIEEYNSHNTHRLNKEEMINLLKKIKPFKT